MTVRCSSLPSAYYCPLAPELDAKYPEAGRSALMSSWFHAHCAGKAPEAKLLWERLTPDEREVVQEWEPPSNVKLPNGKVLEYSAALKEVPVAVTRDFGAVDHGHPDAMVQGTLDFVWLCSDGGLRVGYFGDIKRTQFAAPGGPRSWQLKGYALCGVAKWQLDAYCTGLWITEDSEWIWDDQVIQVGSPEWAADMRGVRSAATTEGAAVTGSHCQDCWSRLHCPIYTAPFAYQDYDARDNYELVSQRSVALSRALRNELDEHNALEAKVEIDRLKGVLELAESNLKEAVRRGLPLYNEDRTKKWGFVECKGRESVSVKLLKSKYPDVAEEVTVRGAPYQQFRKVNA